VPWSNWVIVWSTAIEWSVAAAAEVGGGGAASIDVSLVRWRRHKRPMLSRSSSARIASSVRAKRCSPLSPWNQARVMAIGRPDASAGVRSRNTLVGSRISPRGIAVPARVPRLQRRTPSPTAPPCGDAASPTLHVPHGLQARRPLTYLSPGSLSAISRPEASLARGRECPDLACRQWRDYPRSACHRRGSKDNERAQA
jgi:hypothetical protein